MIQKRPSVFKRTLASLLCVALLSSQPTLAADEKQGSCLAGLATSVLLSPLLAVQIMAWIKAIQYNDLRANALTNFDLINPSNLTPIEQSQIFNFRDGSFGLSNDQFILSFQGLNGACTVNTALAMLLTPCLAAVGAERGGTGCLSTLLGLCLIAALVGPLYVNELAANGAALPSLYDSFKSNSLAPLNQVGHEMNWFYYGEWIYSASFLALGVVFLCCTGCALAATKHDADSDNKLPNAMSEV